MQQVLFRIPLKADWLPFGVPLWAVLLVLFLGVAALLYGCARYAGRWKLDQKNVQGAAVWVAVAGLIVGGLAYGFADSGLPIYGFGMMLFIAFVVCNWVGIRRAVSEGVRAETIQDLAIWVILGGLIGARLTSFLSSARAPKNLWDFLVQFVSIWDGGIVLYGAVIGGLVSYLFAYCLVFRKQRVSTLKLADILAPCLAIGLCLGRIGCFLNGCCYGQVACTNGPVVGVSFPLSAPPRYELVNNGYQTAAGFTFVAGGGAIVDNVEAKSLEEKLGLARNDVIVQVDDAPVWTRDDLLRYVNEPPPSAKDEKELRLEVASPGVPRRTVVIAPWKAGVSVLHFTLSSIPKPAPPVIDRIEPNSAAAAAGLKQGDVIEHADDRPILLAADLDQYIGSFSTWPRGKNDLTLKVRSEDAAAARTIHLWPWTLRLHPTQLYESISMFLLFWVLTFYYPFRRHDGQVMALLMICYAAHRYINELLRADERPEGFESWTSVVLFAAGVVMWLWLARRPAQYRFPAVGAKTTTVPSPTGSANARSAGAAKISAAPAAASRSTGGSASPTPRRGTA
jgi:prolipoprotein diacylglyceryltransferase